MFVYRKLIPIALTFVLLLTVSIGRAANGTWTNDANNVWSGTLNWLNGTVADGTDATADFSTFDITADRTVTLDSSRNIGGLIFGDVTGAQSWNLNSSGGSVLTLAVSSGSPTISVTNNQATINASLAGTAGLTKAGTGTLVLGGVNTYSGNTTVSGGKLQLTNAASTGPVMYLSFNHVGGNIVTNTGSGGAAMNGLIVGAGVSVGAGGPNGNAALSIGSGGVSDGYVLVNSPVVPLNITTNWTVGMWLKTSTTGAVYAYQGDGGWASGNTVFHLNQGSNDLAGVNAGGVRFAQGWETGTSNVCDGAWHFIVMTCTNGVKTNFVDGAFDSWTVINGAAMNQWSGSGTGGQFWIGGTPNAGDGDVRLNGQLAEIYVYNRALSQAEVQALMTASGPVAQPVIPPASAVAVAASTKFDLNGVSPMVGGLSGAGVVDTTLTGGTNQLVVNNSSDTTFTGIISNSVGLLTLHKTGTGALTLSNANTYTGGTILDNGTLNINSAGALSSGTLTLNGGTIDNTSGTPIVTNKTQIWAGDFTFAGTTNLNFGANTVTLMGYGTNRQVTVNANTLSVGPLALQGNSSSQTYGLTKAGAGTLYLGGSSASLLNGSVAINGGTLQIAQDVGNGTTAPSGLTGNGILETTNGVNKWFWINNAADCTFSGTIRNGGGYLGRGLGFNKRGNGKVTLNGTATFNDTITLQAGTLSLVGSGIVISNNASADLVGSTANTKAVLQISSGASFLENYNQGQVYQNSIGVGSVVNALGAIQMSSGVFLANRQLNLAYASNAYASFTQSGGTSTIGGFLALGVGNGFGIFNQSGGSFTMTGAPSTIGAGAFSVSAINLSGTATFTNTATGDNGLWFGESGTGTLNISGGATLFMASGNNGIQLGRNSGANGTANLLGGNLIAKSVYQGSGTGTLNFNGGTLKANIANTAFVSAMNGGAYIYSGGAVIDDGGFAVTVNQALAAPGGYGVTNIPVTAGGSNYFDTPIVLVTNISASGSGAMALAQIDYTTGAITNILVTCPGRNYGSSDTLGVSLIGGGGSGAAIGTPQLDVNVSGGLTKLGAGVLTLGTGNTYTGTTKVLGGTLNLFPSTFSATTDLAVSNATVAADVSSGSSVNVGNITLQNNATVSLAFGNLTANPTFAALNASGSLSAPGTGVTVAISALGLKPGQFTLIKYTGTALPNLNNFSLSLPPGVSASLSNYQANTSIDLVVSTAPKNLTWYGGVDNNWDINSTINWKDNGSDTVYLQYTNGAVIVGDAVTFDDTLLNQQNTNVNLTTGLYAFPIFVNSSLPYSFIGAGSISGTGYLIKTNSGSLTIGTTNTYSGGTYVNGGTLIVTNDTALGASSGSITMGGGTLQINGNLTNTRPVYVTANSTLVVQTNLIGQFGGVLTGAATLTENSPSATVVLSGTMSNTPAIAAGTLRVASGGKIATTGVVGVGNTASSSGILSISGGTVQANNNGGQFASSINAGSIAGAAGSIQMSAGTFTTAQQFGLGAGNGGYGAFTVSGGAATLGSYFVVGFNNDTAILSQSGGSINVATNCLTIGAGGTASLAVGTFSGGTFTSVNFTNGNNSGRGGAFVGENGTGIMNVMGNAALTLIGDVNLTIGRQAGSFGTVNLNGGSVATAQISRGAGSATLNFNGGTLTATTNNGAFLNGLTSATLYSGGANINDGGFTIFAGQSLVAPTGYGVSSIPVTSGGSGYVDAPVVTISGGSGSNATAIAQINYTNGVVTNIIVTCPGTGYGSGDGLGITFTGGGGSGASAGTPVLAALTGGGLTKTGGGTLILGGSNTYSGSTIVSTGQVLVTPAHHVTGAVTVSNTAAFGVLVNGGGAASIGNLNLGTVATGTNYLAISLNTGTNPTAPVLQVGTITLTGTNLVRMSGLLSPGTFPIVKYTGAFAGTGQLLTNIVGPKGVVGTLSNDVANTILYVNITGTGGVVWTGTNTSAALTNVWANLVTNWISGATAVSYSDSPSPGDAVTFNDVGSGTVLMSNVLSPASVLISNNAVNYTFSGPGQISGTGGLLKQGTGTATMNVTNVYLGNTVISNGTIRLGNPAAIPPGSTGGTLSIAPAGTLDLNGSSPTITRLTGSGTINNSSATVPTLTIGNAGVDITWAGTLTNTGTGAITLTKVGTNSLTLSGTNFLGGTSQFNGGTNYLTASGAIANIAGGEFWVQQNAGSSTFIVNGGSLSVSNWLVVGRNNAAANGTLIVNSGTVQKAGANGNIVVGSLNATGTLVVNGGQVLNSGNLWLGENASANASLYLNGGLIQATQVRPNGTAPASSIAYFNGGTLQATASSTNFILLPTFTRIQSGGLVLDDNGFSLTLGSTPLAEDATSPGGGLVKKGSGTVYLNVANNYTGLTLITNGTLAGIGQIESPVLVAPAGNIAAGDGTTNLGTFSLAYTTPHSLTIQGKATLRISKNGGTPASDLITGIDAANYGGTLVISNITSDATPLANGDTFTLFSANTHNGNFTSIVGSPGVGLAYSFTNGVLSVVTATATPNTPVITAISISGSTVSISGTNGTSGQQFRLLSSTNLTLPMTNWTPIYTNTFTGNPFSLTVPITSANAQQFYRVSVP